MSDLVARFRAEADQDAAFESAMRLVQETTAENARLRAALRPFAKHIGKHGSEGGSRPIRRGQRRGELGCEPPPARAGRRAPGRPLGPVTLTIGADTWTGTLTAEDFSRAHDALHQPPPDRG
jgi:hypothetical protein